MKTFRKLAVIGLGSLLGFGLSPASAQLTTQPSNGQVAGGQSGTNAQPNPVVTQDQFHQEAQKVMQNLDDPNYDPAKLPQQIQQMFQDFRTVSQAMDPDQAGQWRQQMMQEFFPVIQRNQAKFQKAMQTAFLLALKDPLGATDDEFAALLPSLEKVSDALRESQGGTARFRFFQRNGQNNTQQPGNQPQSPVDKASADLQAALDDPNSSADLIKTRLDVLRQAKAKANQDLFEARNELRAMLTVRQEAVLLDRGIMD